MSIKNPPEDNVYSHPQEIWDEAECVRRAKFNPKKYGVKNPWPGLIAYSSSPYAEYGTTVYWNGGKIINNEWYQYEHKPLPVIPDSYEFVQRLSWGTYIQKRGFPPKL